MTEFTEESMSTLFDTAFTKLYNSAKEMFDSGKFQNPAGKQTLEYLMQVSNSEFISKQSADGKLDLAIEMGNKFDVLIRLSNVVSGLSYKVDLQGVSPFAAQIVEIGKTFQNDIHKEILEFLEMPECPHCGMRADNNA